MARAPYPDNRSIINQFKQGQKELDDVLIVTRSNIKQSIEQRQPNHALTLLKN